MNALGRVAHIERLTADELLGHESRIRIGAETHRVTAHVLDAARDGEIVCAEGDGTCRRGHGGHRTRAHPVDGVARNRTGEPGEKRCRAAEGESLIAGLSGRSDGDIVDTVFRNVRVPFEQIR